MSSVTLLPSSESLSDLLRSTTEISTSCPGGRFLTPVGDLRPFPREDLGGLCSVETTVELVSSILGKTLKTGDLDILLFSQNVFDDSHTITQYLRYLLIRWDLLKRLTVYYSPQEFQ